MIFWSEKYIFLSDFRELKCELQWVFDCWVMLDYWFRLVWDYLSFIILEKRETDSLSTDYCKFIEKAPLTGFTFCWQWEIGMWYSVLEWISGLLLVYDNYYWLYC